VGRLRGYGNAIVPQVAAEFVKAFMDWKREGELE
jgi:DNA (cytosine-5)-methyltransferase 1